MKAFFQKYDKLSQNHTLSRIIELESQPGFEDCDESRKKIYDEVVKEYKFKSQFLLRCSKSPGRMTC